MNAKNLEQSYQDKKNLFHKYIDGIKKNAQWDLYTIINATLIKNPYTSAFPKKFFSNNFSVSSKFILFIKAIMSYYLKSLYLFLSYLIAFIICKAYYKTKREEKPKIIIDIFALVDKTNQNNKFSENYLTGVYEIFERFNTNHTILLRPYQVGKNPFKLIKFFKIINKDKNNFIFEYELLSFVDFVEIFVLIIIYPFKTLRLLQKKSSKIDILFNYCLIEDLKKSIYASLTRYILGKNISKIASVGKIYSWSEFQAIERSFNYAIRNNNSKIELIGLQFFLNYETYFSTVVDDVDYKMLGSPHKVLVNGEYYIKKREEVAYELGISLRYKDIFTFDGIKKEKHILLLGSYIEKDTMYMLESVKKLDNIIFKNHPAVNVKKFGILTDNITVTNENIYKLFENTKIAIGTASGTAAEAVACGVSVVIVASQDDLTINPLVKHGKGKIWDIAYCKEDIVNQIDKLIQYRINNGDEINKIALWYKDNFFIEPTEENIVKVFNIRG